MLDQIRLKVHSRLRYKLLPLEPECRETNAYFPSFIAGGCPFCHYFCPSERWHCDRHPRHLADHRIPGPNSTVDLRVGLSQWLVGVYAHHLFSATGKLSTYKRQVNELEADLQQTKQELMHHQQLLTQANPDHDPQQAWVENSPLPEANPQPLLLGTTEPGIPAQPDEARPNDEGDRPTV